MLRTLCFFFIPVNFTVSLFEQKSADTAGKNELNHVADTENNLPKIESLFLIQEAAELIQEATVRQNHITKESTL